jgi:hypothetical protein
MLRNTSKTEVVSNDPDIVQVARGIGFDCAQEVKYLGCQVGINPDYHKMWQKVLKNMKAAAELWFYKSSAIWDRVLQAKALILSKVWYLGSVTPIPDTILKEMKHVCKEFVWANKPHKIGQCQFQLPKKEGGLNWWDLDSKVRSLQATWVHKFLTGKVSPSLDALFKEVIHKCPPSLLRG